MLLSVFFISLEALASGILSVIIYSMIRYINIEFGLSVVHTPFYRWLFFTGYYRHSLSFLLGLKDYLNTRWHQSFAKKFTQLFYSSIGTTLSSSNWGNGLIDIYNWFKELDIFVIVLLESFIEAICFVIMGMTIYYMVGLKGVTNIFITSVSLYFLLDYLGFHLPLQYLSL